jgi:hypothetical protein
MILQRKPHTCKLGAKCSFQEVAEVVAHILLAQSCMYLAVRVWESLKIVRRLGWRQRMIAYELPYCQRRLDPGQEAGRSLAYGRGNGLREGEDVDGGFEADEKDSQDSPKSQWWRQFCLFRDVRSSDAAQVAHGRDHGQSGVAGLLSWNLE